MDDFPVIIWVLLFLTMGMSGVLFLLMLLSSAPPRFISWVGSVMFPTPPDADEVWPTDEEKAKARAELAAREVEREQLPRHSLVFLSEKMWFRAECIAAYRSPSFDRVVLVLILANSVSLASMDPTLDETPAFFLVLEYAFNITFTIEMMIKIVAKGLWFSESAYLRDNWNRLDFFVVWMGWLPEILALFTSGSVGNFSVIRTVRILKVLKTIQRVKGMRILVTSMFKSLPQLINVMHLLVFIFFLFGIVALQLFSGALRQRCFRRLWPDAMLIVDDEEAAVSVPVWAEVAAADEPAICSTDPAAFSSCNTALNETCVIRSPTHVYPDGLNDNPSYDNVSFDDIFHAFLTIFVCLSLEGWTDIMTLMMDARGGYVVSGLFFHLLIFFGAFFVMNLILAVICDAYDQIADTVDPMEDEPAEELAPPTPPPVRRRSVAMLQEMGAPPLLMEGTDVLPAAARDEGLRRRNAAGGGQQQQQQQQDLVGGGSSVRTFARRSRRRLASLSDNISQRRRATAARRRQHTEMINKMITRMKDTDDDDESDSKAREYFYKLLFKSVIVTEHFMVLQSAFFWIQSRKWFGSAVTGLIIANTFLMAMESHNMSEATRDMLSDANLVITWAFTVEFVIKLVALGPRTYCSDRFNLFDGAIVCVSLLEIYVLTAGANISVLRTFRLLRVFRTMKIIKKWKTFYKLILVVIRSGPGLLNFASLLFLFIFIFALVGMEFYGGQFTAENGFESTPRSNFDSFGRAILTVFQVVTGEDWNAVLYDTMKVNGVQGAIFIVSMFCVGNYITLNLFLAILLDNFAKTDKAAGNSFFEDIEKENEFLAVTRKVKGGCLKALCCCCCFSKQRRRASAKVVVADAEAPAGPPPPSSSLSLATALVNDDVAPPPQLHLKGGEPLVSHVSAEELEGLVPAVNSQDGHAFFHHLAKRERDQWRASHAVVLPPADKKSDRAADRATIEKKEGDGVVFQFWPRPGATVMDKLTQFLVNAKQKGLTMDDMFRFFDQDGGGTISLREFQRTLAKVKSVGRDFIFSESDTRLIIEHFDTLHDGTVRMVEFKNFCLHIPAECWQKERRALELAGEMDEVVRLAGGLNEYWLTHPVALSNAGEATQREKADDDDMDVVAFHHHFGRRHRQSLAQHDAFLVKDASQVTKLLRANAKSDGEAKPVGDGDLRRSFGSVEHFRAGPPPKIEGEDSAVDVAEEEGNTGETLQSTVLYKRLMAEEARMTEGGGDNRPKLPPLTAGDSATKEQRHKLKLDMSLMDIDVPSIASSLSALDELSPPCVTNTVSNVSSASTDSDVQARLEGVLEELRACIACGVHRRGRKTYVNCFLAKNIVSYLLNPVPPLVLGSMDGMSMRARLTAKRKAKQRQKDSLATKTTCAVVDEATELAQALQRHGFLVPVEKWAGKPPMFLNNEALYCFMPKRPKLIKLQSVKEIKRLRKEQKRAEGEQRTKSMLAQGKSLCILSSSNPVRQFAATLIVQPWFENSILLLIGLSSVALAIDEPWVEPHSLFGRILDSVDIAFTVCFTAEMLLKIVAMGLISGTGTYLRDGWNQLDAFTVGVSLLTLLLSNLELGFLKAIRALRALRPLRMVSRNPGMKTVVNAILAALPSVVNVAAIVLLFFLIFGIMGMTFFSGKLYYCEGAGDADKYSRDRVDCHGVFFNATTGQNVTREWVSHPFAFDNIGMSMVTLFELSSLEMWPSIMFECLDTTEVDLAPKIDASAGLAFYFVLFLVVGSFFVMNLFVGVVIHKFKEIKEAEGKSRLFMTDGQRRWLEMQKACMGDRPQRRFREPTHHRRARMPIFRCVQHHAFELFIMACIMANIVFMSIKHFEQTAPWTDAQTAANFAFNGVFYLEFILKMIGLGRKQYFQSSWNRFDFFIVCCSALDMFGEYLSSVGLDIGLDLTLLRVIRVARISRLIKTSKGLLTLFTTLFYSLPSLVNVGSLLFLMFFVFAVLGMNLFGESVQGNALSDLYNFNSFPSSLLLLFRAATGESWNDIMRDLRGQGFLTAVPFFVAFVILCSFMMLNLFIGVILENFNEIVRKQEDQAKLEPWHIEAFRRAWSSLAPDGEKTVPGFEIVTLLYTLPEPLGLEGAAGVRSRDCSQDLHADHMIFMLEFVRKLRLKRDKFGKIYYQDALQALVRVAFGPKGEDSASTELDTDSLDLAAQQSLAQEFSGKTNAAMQEMQSFFGEEALPDLDLSDEFNSAIWLQSAYRAKQHRQAFIKRLKKEGKMTKRLTRVLSQKTIDRGDGVADCDRGGTKKKKKKKKKKKTDLEEGSIRGTLK